jgi:ferric-dicitrate binding protein FerR (iron transport regulator)
MAWWWSRPVEVTTAPGTTVTRTLPDGSTVELNADTRLTYSRTFSTVSVLEADRRVVRLEGEAYFEVESGDRPFVVRTPTARVVVVGTAFSVRSRDEEGHDTHVALAEGRLRVAGASGSDTAGVALRPGQAVTLGREGPVMAVRDTSLDRVLAWRGGGFAVTAQPLPVLVRSLERRFGTSIRLDSSIPASTRRDSLTLYYSETVDAETILHDVCMARGLTYRATANGYVLSKKERSK